MVLPLFFYVLGKATEQKGRYQDVHFKKFYQIFECFLTTWCPFDVVLVMVCRWQWLPVMFSGLQYQSESWIWAVDPCWQLAVKCLACVTANETAKCSPYCSQFCSATTTQKNKTTDLLR